MNSFYITANESFLLRAAPSFDFAFPLKCLLIRFSNYAPHKFDRATNKCIGFGVCTGLVFPNTIIQVFRETSVIRVIGTFENVDSI